MTPRQTALRLMRQRGTIVGDPDFIVAYLEAELTRNPMAFTDLGEYLQTHLTGVEIADWQVKVYGRWISMPVRDAGAAARYDTALAGVIVP